MQPTRQVIRPLKGTSLASEETKYRLTHLLGRMSVANPTTGHGVHPWKMPPRQFKKGRLAPIDTVTAQ